MGKHLLIADERMKDCGIEFSWAYFGMTMKDAISLSNGLKIFRLEKLIIQASGIDDDNCRLICHALLSNETVTSVGTLLIDRNRLLS